MQRFEGQVVLVTGAANGIGQATAERIASEGGQVVCTDVQTEAVEATAKEIEARARAAEGGPPPLHQAALRLPPRGADAAAARAAVALAARARVCRAAMPCSRPCTWCMSN